jgi:epoxyqueuosine reductase
LADPSPLVRAMAVWALQRLVEPEHWSRLKGQRVARETDADVRTEWGVAG